MGGSDFGDTYAGTASQYWSSSNGSNYGSALSYVPEIPWNDSCASGLLTRYEGFSAAYGLDGFCNSAAAQNQNLLDTGAGGGGPSGCASGTAAQAGVVSGSCAGYTKPSWQELPGNPGDGVRDIPDLTLFAADGVWGHYYVFCYSDVKRGGASCAGAPSGWAGGGGTSFAAPIMAGIQALANQNAGKPQGNPAPAYYSLARAEYGVDGDPACASNRAGGPDPSCIFFDVVEGDNDVVCTGGHDCYRPAGAYGVLSSASASLSPAYGAASGWDFASGIGSVNAANLVTAFASTSASPTPTATTTATSSPSPIPTTTPTATPTATPSAAPTPAGFLSMEPDSLTITARAARRDTMKTRRKSVWLRNKKDGAATLTPGDIQISAIRTSNPQFSPSLDCLGVLKAGARCRVKITFAPEAPGTVSGQLVIESSAANGATQRVALTGIALDHK